MALNPLQSCSLVQQAGIRRAASIPYLGATEEAVRSEAVLGSDPNDIAVGVIYEGSTICQQVIAAGVS